MSTLSDRRFNTELIKLLDNVVTVKTKSGETFTGVLIGYDRGTLSLCLSDVKINKKKYHRVFISGNNVLEILKEESIIDLKKIAEELNKVFPNMVEYYEDAGMIMVVKQVKVTREGVEGKGPIAERVKTIYERLIKESTVR